MSSVVPATSTFEVVNRAEYFAQYGHGSRIRHQGSRFVEVLALRCGERMVATRIDVLLDLRLRRQRAQDRLARVERAERVVASEVEHHRALDARHVVQEGLERDAVEAHRTVDRRACGRQHRELAAKAIADRADLAGVFGLRAQSLHGRFDVAHGEVEVDLLVELKRFREILFAITQQHAWSMRQNRSGTSTT